MTRMNGWEKVLTAFIRKPRAFAWGLSDCCTVTADAIQSITGTDIAADFRGKYSTAAGAIATISAVTGGTTPEDAVAWAASKHGLTEWKYPLCAQRGDLVCVKNADAVIAGFVAMDGVHVMSIGESGLVWLPLAAVTRAWKV